MLFLRGILASLILCYLLVSVAIVIFAVLQPKLEPKTFHNIDVIVVLGAGMDPDGTLHISAIQRVEKGVELYFSGASKRLHFTGGPAMQNGPTGGGQMAALAIRLGVPEAAISTENASFSTLQNALFSYPELAGATRIILVTEGYHLPRSWLSFKWAAWQFDQNVQIFMAHSTPFRTGKPRAAIGMVLRESLAWAFNLSRLAVWHSAGVFPSLTTKRDSWLQ